MEYLVENGKVYKTFMASGGFSKIFHLMQYKVVLEYINGKIQATYTDWEETLQNDYNDMIIFELEGNQIESQAVNGIAEIDFTAVSGSYKITTVNTNIPNGELVITIG